MREVRHGEDWGGMNGRRDGRRQGGPVGSSRSLFDWSCVFRLVTSSKIASQEEDYFVEVEMLCHSWREIVCLLAVQSMSSGA